MVNKMKSPRRLIALAIFAIVAMSAFGFAATNTVDASNAGDGNDGVSGGDVRTSTILDGRDRIWCRIRLHARFGPAPTQASTSNSWQGRACSFLRLVSLARRPISSWDFACCGHNSALMTAFGSFPSSQPSDRGRQPPARSDPQGVTHEQLHLHYAPTAACHRTVRAAGRAFVRLRG